MCESHPLMGSFKTTGSVYVSPGVLDLQGCMKAHASGLEYVHTLVSSAMMEVWTQASRFIWCPLTHRRQLTQHSHRVRFWHLTTGPMARLHDNHSNDWGSASLPSWFLHRTLLLKAKNQTNKKSPVFRHLLCDFVILFRFSSTLVLMRVFWGRREKKLFAVLM